MLLPWGSALPVPSCQSLLACLRYSSNRVTRFRLVLWKAYTARYGNRSTPFQFGNSADLPTVRPVPTLTG